MNLSDYIDLGNITCHEYGGQPWYSAAEVGYALGITGQNDRYKFFGLDRADFAGHILWIPKQQHEKESLLICESYVDKTAILQMLIYS